MSHTHAQTTKFTLCGCILSLESVPCNQGPSCPSINKMKITEEESFCLECFMDAGVRHRWLCLMKELDPEPVLTFVEVEEEEREEWERREREREKKRREKERREEVERKGDKSQDLDGLEDTDEEEEDKEKEKSKAPKPDFGVDVSRACYPVTLTSASVRQRKKERVEAELKRLMALYGDTYFDGEFDF